MNLRCTCYCRLLALSSALTVKENIMIKLTMPRVRNIVREVIIESKKHTCKVLLRKISTN